MSKRQVTLILGICLTLLLPAVQASSAIRPHAFYLSPQAGGYFFHTDQRIKDSPIYGLGLGYRFSPHWTGEMSGSFINAESKDVQENLETFLGRLEVSYQFAPESRFTPYFVFGLGGLLYDNDNGPSDLDAVAEYGIGFQFSLTESLALRIDGRHLFTAENEDMEGKEFQHFAATGGFLVEFGGEETRPQILDTDGDGVIDTFDRCPGTQLGVPVDGYGCPADADRDDVPDYLDQCPGTPAGVSVDRNGCPADRDRDGVADHLDRCPDTPAGTEGDAQGCPASPATGDSDRDGVPDTNDQCPGTPAGMATDPSGCVASEGQPTAVPLAAPDGMTGGIPLPAALELNLEFLPREADIRLAFESKLEEALRYIAAHPGERIVVEGHTDAIGQAEANLKLSQARAENVRRYLIDKGAIRPEMITAHGFGESQPIADNSTQYGRVQNRRIVIRTADRQ